MCLSVGFFVSKTTAICDGFSFLKISRRELVKPKTADVSKPFELILGFLANAKYAL